MSLILPEIPNKPRKTGITMVLEKGMDPISFKNLVSYYHDRIDIVKFTSGIAIVDQGVKEKIEICKEFGVSCYFGGTLFEKFFSQNKLNEYLDFVRSFGVEIIEISNGTLDISLEQRVEILHRFKSEGFQVYVEVGSKDLEEILAPSTWINEMSRFLTEGADYLITEARESGRAGLFRTSGEIRDGLLKDILTHVDISKVIFEAPNSASQAFFINEIGPDVNLGNVSVDEVNMLRVQRQGLRFETFNIS
ncbi:MAG: phosphosulfolactate synthase [Methyloprofundus sp.]|nr:phosphosulfolactate synthase [Methyloprofundus sp.]